jgi:hypothetical protein
MPNDRSELQAPAQNLFPEQAGATELSTIRPQVCTDPEGFDRTAFHREFNAAVVKYFREQLAGGER